MITLCHGIKGSRAPGFESHWHPLSKRSFTCLVHKRESNPHMNTTPLFWIIHAPVLSSISFMHHSLISLETSAATLFATGHTLKL